MVLRSSGETAIWLQTSAFFSHVRESDTSGQKNEGDVLPQGA